MRVPPVPVSFLPAGLLLLAAAACGGGGGGGGGGAAVVLPSASLSALVADPASAPADGTQVLLTATIRDDRGGALAGRIVLFTATGTGTQLLPERATTDAAGLAISTLSATVAGPVRVTAIVEPDRERIQLLTEVTVDFTPPNAPLVQGLARFVDVDRDGTAGAGDRIVVPFSRSIVVDNPTVADFTLPVTNDSFGSGASVAAGPSDREVTVTLGNGARLRTRGRFAAGVVNANEPSGIDVLPTNAIRDVATDSPAASSTPIDVAAAPTTPATLAGTSAGVATGDFDTDGTQDLLVGGGNQLLPLLGDGALDYVAASPLAAPGTVLAVDAANLNRLGADEAVTAHDFGVQVWNNNGAPGTQALQTAAQIALANTRTVRIADLDRDGFPDLVVGRLAGVTVLRHQRNAGNSFTNVQDVPLADVVALAIDDVDSDGTPDVIAGLAAGSVRILLNVGGQLVGAGILATGPVSSVSAADVDGNGRPAVAVADGGDVRVFRQQGGVFTPTTLPQQARVAAFVDADRDAFQDLVLLTDDGIELWQNDRAGGFEPVSSQTFGGPVAIVAKDLDDDGDLDLAFAADVTAVAAGSSAGTFGDTTFVATTDLGVGEAGAMAFGDVDGDDTADRLAGVAGGVEIRLGDGLGGFLASGQFGSATPNAIALGDLDGDLDLDAVLGFDGSNQVWANINGNFALALELAPGSVTLCLALLDYDQDGDLDLVFGNDGPNQLFENVSTSVFAFTEDTQAFASLAPNVAVRQTIALIAHDVDLEGDADLIVVNGGTEIAPQDTFLLKLANGIFTLNQTFPAQLLATAATLGDRDGDGRLDLVLARRSAAGNATLQTYRGQANNFNTLPQNLPGTPGVTIAAVVMRDIDGDGDDDLVLANVGSPSEVWRQAAGAFVLSQQFELNDPIALFAGDVDRDGDVDLVTLETAGPSRVLQSR